MLCYFSLFCNSSILFSHLPLLCDNRRKRDGGGEGGEGGGGRGEEGGEGGGGEVGGGGGERGKVLIKLIMN